MSQDQRTCESRPATAAPVPAPLFRSGSLARGRGAPPFPLEMLPEEIKRQVEAANQLLRPVHPLPPDHPAQHMAEFESLMSRFPPNLVKLLRTTPQSTVHHPEGSVYNHKMQIHCYIRQAFRDSEARRYLLVTNLFHDFGKIDTLCIRPYEGYWRISAHGHELASLDYVHKYFRLFSDITTDFSTVFEVIKCHMRAHHYVDGTMKNRSKRARFEALKVFSELVFFEDCDCAGRYDMAEFMSPGFKFPARERVELAEQVVQRGRAALARADPALLQGSPRVDAKHIATAVATGEHARGNGNGNGNGNTMQRNGSLRTSTSPSLRRSPLGPRSGSKDAPTLAPGMPAPTASATSTASPEPRTSVGDLAR